jgi:peptidyl-prolyl cis-trans isomerase SurA
MAAMALCAAFAFACVAMQAQNVPAPQPAVVLDRVEAVVNNQAILASDIQSEIKLSVLDPERGARRQLSARRALQLLISRALIQQQVGQANMQAPEPTDKEIKTRVQEMREQLPACVLANCASDAGWASFLETNGLTEAEVESNTRLRLVVLGFIESRFRQGIQISQEEIEKYYRETLLPEYPKNEQAPALDSVAPRIQEILLQQQVNALFGTWLQDLRKQGDVEVLDRELEPALNGDQTGNLNGEEVDDE